VDKEPAAPALGGDVRQHRAWDRPALPL